MFGIFKRKSALEKLENQYAIALKEAFTLSKINRTASDAKQVEAENILSQIESLRSKG